MPEEVRENIVYFSQEDSNLIAECLTLAMHQIDYLVGSCPDVIEYSECLVEYEAKKAQINDLLTRVLGEPDESVVEKT